MGAGKRFVLVVYFKMCTSFLFIKKIVRYKLKLVNQKIPLNVLLLITSEKFIKLQNTSLFYHNLLVLVPSKSSGL